MSITSFFMTPTNELICPCGSPLALDECCGRYHQGAAAPDPEALMRSRYSAFALGLNTYLLATWHPSTRPEVLEPDPDTAWKSLVIVHAEPALAHRGQVHFRAFFVAMKGSDGVNAGTCWKKYRVSLKRTSAGGTWMARPHLTA